MNTENNTSAVINEPTPGNPLPKDPPLTQAEKDAKFLEAHKALARIMKLRKKKHRNQNAGAFGGAGTKRKGKKKLARYLERNTIL